MKRRPSDWLKIVKLYVDDGMPMSKLAEKYHFHVSHLKHKINVYLIHGEKPFTDEQEASFDVGEPYKVFGTDVTQFRFGEGKLYLSPIIAFHTREIVAYDISIHPNMLQIKRMMHQLEDKYEDYLYGSIIHKEPFCCIVLVI